MTHTFCVYLSCKALELPDIAFCLHSYCLGWKGQYKPDSSSSNTTESVKLNTPYRLAALLEAPLAVGDRTAANNKPKQVRVGGQALLCATVHPCIHA
jgi:hypothetical protein